MQTKLLNVFIDTGTESIHYYEHVAGLDILLFHKHTCFIRDEWYNNIM